jgi:hypothetical protein
MSIQPWYSLLSVDLLVYCANRTVLQPFFAWMLPLSLRAVTIPYSHISFQLTTIYASVITLLWVLGSWNRTIAYGSPRKVGDEIVLITGGANGLGKVIADFYSMKGSSVVVLDIEEPKNDEEDGVEYYKCDVGNSIQVKAVCDKIIEEVGIPTILINNAGIMNGKSILDLSDDDLSR